MAKDEKKTETTDEQADRASRFVETIGGYDEGRVVAHHKTAIDIRNEAKAAEEAAKKAEDKK